MKSANADEIKSVLSSDKVGFHHGVISSTTDGFIPSVRTALVEKNPHLSTTNVGSFLSMGYEKDIFCVLQ